MSQTSNNQVASAAEYEAVRHESQPTYLRVINAKESNVTCPNTRCRAPVPVEIMTALKRLDLDKWASLTGLPGISNDAIEMIHERRVAELDDKVDTLENRLAATDAEAKEKDSEIATLKSDVHDLRRKLTRLNGETSDKIEAGRDELVKAMLGVPDAIDGALKQAENQGGADSGFLEGIRMLRDNVDAVLGAAGYHAQKVLHEDFDPKLHEAASPVVTPDHDPGTIVDEMRRGYANSKSGKVIRPALVGVALAPSEEQAEVGESEGI